MLHPEAAGGGGVVSMTEYISRDKVLSHKWEVRSYDPSDPDPVTEVVSVSSIMCIPAADVVEVVRCRECKHSIMHKFPYNYEKVLTCNDPHGVTIRAVKPMHFCADGERKDGGQDDV